MMRRIRDGNDIKPPRNMIDLVSFAKQAQSRREDREPRSLEEDKPIIEPESLRRGLGQLSQHRVTDTLLAEAVTYAPMIERFRRGKAEQDESSLASILGLQKTEVREAVKPLVELGFLEDIKGTYKVPSLYRDGLEITQGKAFGVPPNANDNVDDEDD